MKSTLRRRGDGVVGRSADSGSSFRRIFRCCLCWVCAWSMGADRVGIRRPAPVRFEADSGLARQLGRGMREVKQTVADVDPREDVKRSLDTKPIEAPDDESSAER